MALRSYGLHIPSWTIDSGDLNAEQCVRDDGYERLIDRLVHEEEFREESLMLTSHNKTLVEMLRSFMFNPWYCHQKSWKRAEIAKKTAFTLELMVGWIVRLYNSKMHVFPIVVLSFWALRCSVPKLFWNACRKVKLLYSRDKTEAIALDVGRRVQHPTNYPTWASRKVVMGAGDNCLIKFNTSYEGCRDDGDGRHSYLFINWFTRPVRAINVPDEYDPTKGATTSPLLLFVLYCFNNRANKKNNPPHPVQSLLLFVMMVQVFEHLHG